MSKTKIVELALVILILLMAFSYAVSFFVSANSGSTIAAKNFAYSAETVKEHFGNVRRVEFKYFGGYLKYKYSKEGSGGVAATKLFVVGDKGEGFLKVHSEKVGGNWKTTRVDMEKGNGGPICLEGCDE